MKEYGGYIGFELEKKEEYYLENKLNMKIKSLNSARSALLYCLKINKITKIYCPYYICESVINSLKENNIEILFYELDDNLFPKNIEEFLDEYIIWPNYFGIFSSEIINKKFRKNKKVILDNTQAFFSQPIEDKISIYSCRKFFGVPDGAYLIAKNLIDEDIENEVSYNKISFLFKSIELGTNEGYLEHLENEKKLEKNKIIGMSKLTKQLLCTYDYEKIKNIRQQNFLYLHKKLEDYNQIAYLIDVNNINAPMVYPFLIEIEDMREYLIKNKIYIPNWWGYLLEIVPRETLEYKMSKYLLPLPIDQRYSEIDMEYIGNIIIKFIEERNGVNK